MRHTEFHALSYIPLKANSVCAKPAEPPSFVYLDDPALSVMTDFETHTAITITASASIDEALEHMKASGVRLLLVIDAEHSVIGLITSTDIMGERPITLAQELRIPHTEIAVNQIMTPLGKIEAFDFIIVNEARVGHIVETLNQLERQHMLVVEADNENDRHVIRGLFSISQISKQLHRDVKHHAGAAHSLAEIIHDIK